MIAFLNKLQPWHKWLVAFFIACLFHWFGFWGMRNNQEFFFKNTPLNLYICFILILFTQNGVSNKFLRWIALAFGIGFFSEVVGVNSGLLFGSYHYGSRMGLTFWGVPITIGCNWIVVSYCSACITSLLFFQFKKNNSHSIAEKCLFSIGTASIATFFDYCIEPGATFLEFWTWHTAPHIPVYNYVCWFACSFLLAWFFYKWLGLQKNWFAIGLLFLQAIFFIGIIL